MTAQAPFHPPPGPALPHGAGKRDLHSQAGAICLRQDPDGPRILLVTSRDTGRWVIPKGWPVPGLPLAEAARLEAWQEAGVTGPVDADCIGAYTYAKRADRRNREELYCLVALYRIHIEQQEAEWPEMADRLREWFTPEVAAGLVEEPELARQIRLISRRA